jgi:hypothetical protein
LEAIADVGGICVAIRRVPLHRSDRPSPRALDRRIEGRRSRGLARPGPQSPDDDCGRH